MIRSETNKSHRDKEFVVMKFNDKNRFFGYSRANNSLVPYESTFLTFPYDDVSLHPGGFPAHTP